MSQEHLTAAQLLERTDKSIGDALKEAFPHAVAAETSADDLGSIVDAFREIMIKHHIRMVDDRRVRSLIDEAVYQGACYRANRLEALCRQHGIDPSPPSATEVPKATTLDLAIGGALDVSVRQDPEFAAHPNTGSDRDEDAGR